MLPLNWFGLYPAKAEFNTLPKDNRKYYSIFIKLFLNRTYKYYLVIEIK